MRSAGSGRTVRILGRGVREIDEKLLYSAAWLDDPRPGREGIAWFRTFDPAPLPQDNRSPLPAATASQSSETGRADPMTVLLPSGSRNR